MITIFSIPKPFLGHVDIIQRNAIESWLKIYPKPEVILFGDEEGLDKAAKEFGVSNILEIEKNEFGTPLLNSAFSLAQKIAKNDLLVYINTDNILTSDFIPTIQKVDKPLFLLSGQRRDMDIKEPLQFDKSNWEEELREDIAKKGKLHRPSGMDYCVFPRNLLHDLPSFTVGRPGWDNWLIYHFRSHKIPVIDATKVVTVIHQTHCIDGKRDKGPEARYNIELAGGFSQMLTLRDADWLLTEEGLKRPPFLRKIFSKLSLFYPWRFILGIKRKLQSLL